MRPFISQHRFQVHHVAHNGVFIRDTHTAVYLARFAGDAAWPGPVWGSGEPKEYGEELLEDRVAALRSALATHPSFDPA